MSKQTHQESTIDRKKILRFRSLVLLYWQRCGRKNLPWRKTRDPWKILLAETLLRKTTSTQAVLAYNQLEIYSPYRLSRLNSYQLRNILKPLGLYKVRARQLRQNARTVTAVKIKQLGNAQFLESLPGVGRYITNSILSISFDIPKPALDTNMIRVLCRVFSIRSKRSRARDDRSLWLFAEKLVPKTKSREFNWGVLDLATFICRPKNPMCVECCLKKICSFYKVQNA